MSKLSKAIQEKNRIEQQANQNRWLNRIHPLVKLFLTIFYITLVVSVGKYNMNGLLGFGIYPLIVFMIGEIPFGVCWKRIRIVFPVVCIAGIFNPFFDREILVKMGILAVSGGVISMFTLMIKGFFTVLAAYLFMITTSIERSCEAMRKVRIPAVIITVILLMDRYIIVLMQEADRLIQAYSLRAPAQKGIHFKAWGSLVGLLLLRSMDRANEIYDSMRLRGYDTAMERRGFLGKRTEPVGIADLSWLFFWVLLMSMLRIYPGLTIIGDIVMKK